MKRKNWTDQEINTLLKAYFRILNAEMKGGKVNKAAIRREVLPQLDNRSNGSYEMKMMNISAAMLALDLPIIPGYKPYGHAQKSIQDIIKAALAAAA